MKTQKEALALKLKIDELRRLQEETRRKTREAEMRREGIPMSRDEEVSHTISKLVYKTMHKIVIISMGLLTSSHHKQDHDFSGTISFFCFSQIKISTYKFQNVG